MVRFSARQLVGAALGAWLLVGALALIAGPPLGHDEAAYAVAARGDAPVWNYRSTGMIAIARVGLALGGGEAALRAVILIVATSLILGAFALGRAAFDARTGAWAALVLVGAHPMASRNAELIGDLAATGLMLCGLAVLFGVLERAQPRWSLLLVAPLFTGAFYLRYGCAPVIAMVAVLAVILYAKQVASLPMLATVALSAVLVVPYVQHSIDATGSVLGILKVSAHMPRRAYIGEGLVTYLTSNPFRFYGALVAPVMLAGLASLVKRAPRWRPQVFLIVLALAQIVSLGLQSHGQPRYVFFATALLVIAGVDAIRRCFAARPIERIGEVALVLVGTAWLVLTVLIVPFHRDVARRRAPLYAAAAAVRDDAKGRPCAIAANVVPQLIWATHCPTIVASVAPQQSHPWPPTELHYIVSVPHAELGPHAIDDVAASVPGAPRELSVAQPEARVWRIDPTP